MKNFVLLLLSVTFLTSCRLTYYYPNTSRVEKVLGVTHEGDTIQVPIDYFGDRTQGQYDFNLQYFYWRNDWFLYNPNIYNRRWFVNNWWWNPYTPFGYPTYIYRPNNVWRPRSVPREEPRRWRSRTNIEQRRNEVQPNRGRSNQTQVRQPVYNRPTRQRVTTPPPTPSNRNSTVRSNNNSRSTNGARPIKQ